MSTLLNDPKNRSKYCQIVLNDNRIKRFIYACMIKYYNDTFDCATFIDECLRNATSKNWSSRMGRKRENIDKHKHNIKLHLRGGISYHGLTPLITFYRYYVKY